LTASGVFVDLNPFRATPTWCVRGSGILECVDIVDRSKDIPLAQPDNSSDGFARWILRLFNGEL
jgi:hypothetical protein